MSGAEPVLVHQAGPEQQSFPPRPVSQPAGPPVSCPGVRAPSRPPRREVRHKACPVRPAHLASTPRQHTSPARLASTPRQHTSPAHLASTPHQYTSPARLASTPRQLTSPAGLRLAPTGLPSIELSPRPALPLLAMARQAAEQVADGHSGKGELLHKYSEPGPPRQAPSRSSHWSLPPPSEPGPLYQASGSFPRSQASGARLVRQDSLVGRVKGRGAMETKCPNPTGTESRGVARQAAGLQ